MLTFKPDPGADESLNGYLLRLVETNSIGSANVVLRIANLRAKAGYAEPEVAAIARSLELDLHHIQRLAAFSAIRGSLASGSFLRKSAIPACPRCLLEAGYIRQAWHHELVTACPAHRVRLIDHCPDCKAPLELNRASVGSCRCGYSLAGLPQVAAENADLFIASLLMPQRGTKVTLSGFAAGQLPEDNDQFWLFLANLTLQVPQRKNAAFSCERAREINRAAFAIAEDLEKTFPAYVARRVQHANEQQSSQFFRNLGTWYKELNSSFAGEPYASLRNMAYAIIVSEAQAPINRKLKQIGAELLEAKRTFTAAEAARQLRSSPDRIVSLVKSGQLAGQIVQGASVEFCLVERSAVEAEKRAAEGLMPGKDLLKTLNITRRVRERLVHSGVLTRAAEAERPLFAKGDYRLVDVQRLLQGWADVDIKDGGGTLLGLEDISGKRFSSEQANELYRLIFSGHIKPAQRLDGIQGLAAFRFALDDLTQHLRQDTGQLELTITDLTRITRWKHEAIKSWIDAGILPHRLENRDGKKQAWISVAHLIEFLSTNIVAADAALRLETRSVWLTKRLARKGVLARGAHATSEGSLRGLLLSTDALINVASGRAPLWRRGDPAGATG